MSRGGIDYSKWDNLVDSSDDDDQSTQPPRQHFAPDFAGTPRTMASSTPPLVVDASSCSSNLHVVSNDQDAGLLHLVEKGHPQLLASVITTEFMGALNRNMLPRQQIAGMFGVNMRTDIGRLVFGVWSAFNTYGQLDDQEVVEALINGDLPAWFQQKVMGFQPPEGFPPNADIIALQRRGFAGILWEPAPWSNNM
ncbi:unnamed protein product [Vitrella brassicaformis CCMP3155]|uniref:Uncharacterized protein n=1 Tax=Vitrella brassicaformis (strain CCMP3155) TaxID=1169540 RepID=A0A0G4F6Q9_VITBC|nr:unnamed protein product [Vitrella brassicaformis CCMP3155]|eukprot:CEM07803.1 unnamed protein product [Vitrella brassicaformis CCMP3155]